MNKFWVFIYIIALNVFAYFFGVIFGYLGLCIIFKETIQPNILYMAFSFPAFKVMILLIFPASIITLIYTILSKENYRILVCALLTATAYPIFMIIGRMAETIKYHNYSALIRDIVFGYVVSFTTALFVLYILSPIKKKIYHTSSRGA